MSGNTFAGTQKPPPDAQELVYFEAESGTSTVSQLETILEFISDKITIALKGSKFTIHDFWEPDEESDLRTAIEKLGLIDFAVGRVRASGVPEETAAEFANRYLEEVLRYVESVDCSPPSTDELSTLQEALDWARATATFTPMTPRPPGLLPDELQEKTTKVLQHFAGPMLTRAYRFVTDKNKELKAFPGADDSIRRLALSVMFFGRWALGPKGRSTFKTDVCDRAFTGELTGDTADWVNPYFQAAQSPYFEWAQRKWAAETETAQPSEK